MSNNAWYARYVGDYQRKTAHLSLCEHGAYAMMLDTYYATGRPLPANAEQVHRICRAFAEDEKAAVKSVLEQFFHLQSDGYHNDKADEELLKREKISENRRKAAISSRASAPAFTGANAQQVHQQMPTQPQPQYSVPYGTDAKASSGEVSPEPDLKTRIFGPMLDWLKKQSGKPEAQCRSMLGRWCKNHGEARTIEAVTAAARNAPLDPIPYVERIIRDGKSKKPTARQSVTDHASGLASVLGVGGMDAGSAKTAEPDGRQIEVADGGTDPGHATGDCAAIRAKHDEIDRVRGGIRPAVRRSEISASDLPGNASRLAGGLAGAGGIAPEISMDVGEPDAVSSRIAGDGGGRSSGKTVVVGEGADCGAESARGNQEQRDFSGPMGRTAATDTESGAEQTDKRGLRIGWAA